MVTLLCLPATTNTFHTMELMSQEGYDKLVAELHEMVQVELPKVIDAISEARDKGDLSENFEYRAAKREQSRLLGRIRFKQNILAHARVAPAVPDDGRVRLLSCVAMTNLGNGRKVAYTLTSPHEADVKQGKISVKSPIGKALMGRRQGDDVEVSVPAGTLRLHIDSVGQQGSTTEE